METNARGPRSYTWVFGFLALAVLLFMVWLVWPSGDGGEGMDTIEAAGEVEEIAPVEPPVGEELFPVAEIANASQQWEARLVSGTTVVDEVVPPHGFWISGDGSRLFVLVDEEGGPAPELSDGDEIHLNDARVRPVEGEGSLAALPPEVQEIVADEPVYLLATGTGILQSTPR